MIQFLNIFQIIISLLLILAILVQQRGGGLSGVFGGEGAIYATRRGLEKTIFIITIILAIIFIIISLMRLFFR